MARQFAKAFYKSRAWHKIRSYVLLRDSYLCVKCGKPAEEVHHITHLTPDNINDPEISLNPDNLMSLCRDCHFEQHRGDHGLGRAAREKEEPYDYEFDENGYLVRVSPRSDT